VLPLSNEALIEDIAIMTTQMQLEARSTYVNVSAEEEPINENAGTALSSGTVKRHFEGGFSRIRQNDQ
jgi:hypothetical protein